MKTEKIDHVSILVRDLETARKRYSDLFGIEFRGPSENPQLDIKTLSSSQGITLVSPLSSNGPMARLLERRGEGVNVVVLRVDNVSKAVTEMKAKGVRQVGGSERSAIFHPGDLHGVMIEIVGD